MSDESRPQTPADPGSGVPPRGTKAIVFIGEVVRGRWLSKAMHCIFHWLMSQLTLW